MVRNDQSLGGRVKALREEKKLNQVELAEKSGLNAPTLYRIEEGQVLQPGPAILWRLADALGTTTDYLIGRVKTPGASVIPVYDKVAHYFLGTYKKLSGPQRARLVRFIRALELEDEDDPEIRDVVYSTKSIVTAGGLKAKREKRMRQMKGGQ